MNERHQQQEQQGAGGQGGGGHQQEILHGLPDVHARRQWSLDQYIEQFKKEMEVRFMFSEADLAREVQWFSEFEYGRAITQLHVEQVYYLKLKERKEVYKRWRADLGDERARRHAKFAEYVIQNGGPAWFKKELTQFPDMNVLRPSCVSTDLPVSWRPQRHTPLATQRR